MINANPVLAPKDPMPRDLNAALPNHQTPWNISSPLFQRVRAQKAQNPDQPFKISEILSSDPEFNFILKYFEHHKPSNYSIKRIVCIHNPDHTQMFESTLKNMEREANNPVFAPKGKEEEPVTARALALTRWKKQADQFSPVEIESSISRTDSCIKAKVLPLWHGSSEEVCKSVCSSGFTSFGKHHYFDESAKKGNTKNTDKGYFGSGIYFTNSAHYASMYSEGHLLMAWVSMREPYPVVNDVPHPQKGADMVKLAGHKHYQNYNAHYIPVASINPHNPKCLDYYPCYKDQPPAWDEFVVFEKAQTLPRFWIELVTDLTIPVGSSPMQIIKNIAKPANEGNLEAQAVIKSIYNLYGASGWLGSWFTKKPVLKSATPAAAKQDPKISHKALQIELAASHSQGIKLTFPAIAFGKKKWKIYVGDIEDTSLPNDIDQILKSPCPFWPGKKVEETHLLILIPKTVDGKPLTLNTLNELVQHPKKGQATTYTNYIDGIKKEHGSTAPTSSYWVLLTKDIIPNSQDKSYEDQKQLLVQYNKNTLLTYEMPRLLEVTVSILIEYLQTSKPQPNSKSWTYTTCQERLSSDPNMLLIVGGFPETCLDIIKSNSRYYGIRGIRKL